MRLSFFFVVKEFSEIKLGWTELSKKPKLGWTESHFSYQSRLAQLIHDYVTWTTFVSVENDRIEDNGVQ